MTSCDLTPQIKKYGYYTVGSSVYLNKTQAAIASNITNQKINFHYNEDIFDSYDWTQEPEPGVGLAEFYRRRALQIRNKYDYVILLYSGGPDSTNVLNSFVDNNILIDEIVNMNSYKQTGVVENTIHNADYVYNVEPHLKPVRTHLGASGALNPQLIDVASKGYLKISEAEALQKDAENTIDPRWAALLSLKKSEDQE